MSSAAQWPLCALHKELKDAAERSTHAPELNVKGFGARGGGGPKRRGQSTHFQVRRLSDLC